jgi:hypothetical protein
MVISKLRCGDALVWSGLYNNIKKKQNIAFIIAPATGFSIR